MLAAVVPSVNGKWEVKEVATPRPGVNQVLIKMHASGICYTDVHATHGALGVKFPYTIGHEPAGEIVELVEGVTTRTVGDRVGVPWFQSTCGRCEWCQRGKSLFCPNHIATGINIAGGHAEYMVAYADASSADGGGADVILATSNSYKATADAIKGLRPDGRVILMGVSPSESLTVPPEILFKRIRIIGSTQNDREHLYEALDYVAKGKV